MSADIELLDQEDEDVFRAQWRGSGDGIMWTAWSVLTHPRMLIPYFPFVQARVWAEGKWHTSPVNMYPEDWS